MPILKFLKLVLYSLVSSVPVFPYGNYSYPYCGTLLPYGNIQVVTKQVFFKICLANKSAHSIAQICKIKNACPL